jgi:selenocysteine lyase/cysteine desulfurase
LKRALPDVPGSYGSPPVPVLEAMQKLSDEIEAYPDLFMRRSWLPRLDKVRSLVAEIIGAQTDEVVMVPNATHGVNNVVTQIAWQDGDVIVVCEPLLLHTPKKFSSDA